MDLTLVQTQPELERTADTLSRHKVVAFDIECSSNLHHYVQRVCLMQFCAGGVVHIVDPLRDLDLTPIGRSLEDREIEIVMHDTDFDLRSLDRDYAWRPNNLFDTLIAARLCGHKEFGLASLLEKHFGTRSFKKFQKADWTIRPLPSDMLAYAASDVIQLEKLRDLLSKELERLGRMEWARAEFAQCEDKRFEPDERPLFARVKNARETCNGRELAILNELAIARDEIARTLDMPHFMVIGDPKLIELAKRAPKKKADIESFRGIHPACRSKFAERITEAVIKGVSGKELSWPRSKRGERHKEPSPPIFSALKEWRAGYAKELQIDPDLILSMSSLRRLAASVPVDEVLSKEPINVWRGNEIEQAISEILKRNTRP